MTSPSDTTRPPEPAFPETAGPDLAEQRVPDTTPPAAVDSARDAAIADSILRLVAERGPRSICPSDAARAVAQAEGRADWQRLLGSVRRIAGRLQSEGRVQILRKGRPAAADVRGVIRLRGMQPGEAPGPAAQAAADPAGVA